MTRIPCRAHRGAGQQIDPDPAEQLALGFGDERVAGPDQHVDGLEAVDEAERHRRQALDAAEGEGGVGAGGLDGGLARAGAIGDEHSEPVLGQTRGARAADPAGSAGDQGYLHAGLPSLTHRLR